MAQSEEVEKLKAIIKRLNKSNNSLQQRISKQQIEIEENIKRRDHAELKLEQINKNTSYLKESVNSLTAERSKWIRKLRRAGVKV